MEEESDNEEYYSEINWKLRDLEDKENLVRDRVLLIGKNLVDIREKTKDEINDLKRQVESLDKEVKKVKEVMENVMEYLGEFARKEEVEMIARKMDMFSPLEFARIEDVKKMLKKRKS